MSRLACWLAAALVCGSWATATAQNAISAKAGLVQVTDGEVFVNDKAVQPKIAEFIDLKNTDTLRTGEGRTEVLLTPGAFLRMGDNSSFRMVSSRLDNVRLEMVQGEAMIEISEMLSDNAITMSVGGADFQLPKGGIYRFDADPARIRVYKGEATVQIGEKLQRVKEGHEMTFNGSTWTQSDFNTKDNDALYRWSQRRSENIAVANVSAARQSGNSYGGYSAMDSGSYGYPGWGGYGAYPYLSYGYGGYGYGGFGYAGASGGWMFNPYFGMFTFMPFYGTAWSPFGYAFYTPVTVVPVYAFAQSQLPASSGGRLTPNRPAVPGASGRTVSTSAVNRGLQGGVRTPAFTSATSLRTSTVTRGMATAHTSYGGYSNGSFSGGHYSGNPSSASYSSPVSSASPVSSGRASAPAAASGGGGGGRSH